MSSPHSLTPRLRRNLSAYGFLIGGVLCFALFSWYPMVREFIMSFQKTQLGGPSQLPAHLQRPDVLDGLAEHIGVHPPRAAPRLRGAVLRRDPAERAAACQGIPALPGVPAGHASASERAAAVLLLLRPEL